MLVQHRDIIVLAYGDSEFTREVSRSFFAEAHFFNAITEMLQDGTCPQTVWSSKTVIEHTAGNPLVITPTELPTWNAAVFDLRHQPTRRDEDAITTIALLGITIFGVVDRNQLRDKPDWLKRLLEEVVHPIYAATAPLPCLA